MIKIDITYDIVIEAKDISTIGDVSGLYVLMGESNEPLYVGLSKDLKTRAQNHITHRTDLRKWAHHFKKVALVYEPNELKRKMGEFCLINSLQPPLNRSLKYRSHLSVNNKAIYEKQQHCQGRTVRGTKCRAVAHSNGFCHLHGGNGESLTKLRKDALQKIDKELKNRRD